jgi:hypothetical protein
MIGRIEELAGQTLGRVREAGTPEELEAVRVEVLGRKGSLAEFGKLMGKLSGWRRARR